MLYLLALIAAFSFPSNTSISSINHFSGRDVGNYFIVNDIRLNSFCRYTIDDDVLLMKLYGKETINPNDYLRKECGYHNSNYIKAAMILNKMNIGNNMLFVKYNEDDEKFLSEIYYRSNLKENAGFTYYLDFRLIVLPQLYTFSTADIRYLDLFVNEISASPGESQQVSKSEEIKLNILIEELYADNQRRIYMGCNTLVAFLHGLLSLTQHQSAPDLFFNDAILTQYGSFERLLQIQDDRYAIYLKIINMPPDKAIIMIANTYYAGDDFKWADITIKYLYHKIIPNEKRLEVIKEIENSSWPDKIGLKKYMYFYFSPKKLPAESGEGKWKPGKPETVTSLYQSV